MATASNSHYGVARTIGRGGTCALAADEPLTKYSTSSSSTIASTSAIKLSDAALKIDVPDFVPIPNCFAQCAIRTVQETRIWCSVSDRPAHIDGWGKTWLFHEEIRLVEEEIYIDSNCNETVLRRNVTVLNSPLYWPEDDIFNPVSYYDSGLADFDCSDHEYNSTTNETEPFIYRIVVEYQFLRCDQ